MPDIPMTGWVILVQRLRMEQRPKKTFARTVGSYQVHHEGKPVTALAGTTVERQGPGDNGPTGHAHHNRIEAGVYALLTHRTAKYATTGFKKDGGHPRPALGVEPRGARSAVLIHPAGEYGSTIGCINLSGPLEGPRNNIKLGDSVGRVIDVIGNLQAYAGVRFPKRVDAEIPDACLIIRE
jgi:hypothetical protein